MEKLALLGGKPVLKNVPEKKLFGWPILTKEDINAALYVIKNNKFSGTDITLKFQEEFAKWQQREYALAFCNGTAALTAAMFAIGLSKGDEIICSTKTYWGSISQAINFGASAVFCNINEMLSMDPDDLERCITPKTKAIMVVHYLGYPCDMDRIMEIAKKHNLYVIEDLSHAQGGMYKGKKLGTFGDIAAMSLMSQKAFSAGELGIIITDNRRLYERAIAFGHYERNNDNNIKECEDLKPYFHVALGGIKGRANQVSSAIARVQLKYYDKRSAEIRKSLNYFWDLLEGQPGLKPIRVDESTGSTMGGWWSPHGRYVPEELHGLSAKKFAEAVRAEGFNICWEGANFCLHTHDFFKSFDLYNDGKPSRIANSERDLREDDNMCKPSEEIYCVSVPWFKHFNKKWIERYAEAYKKVIKNHEQLLEKDKNKSQGGRWYGAENE